MKFSEYISENKKIKELEKMFQSYDSDAWEIFIADAKKKGYTEKDIKDFNKYMEKN